MVSPRALYKTSAVAGPSGQQVVAAATKRNGTGDRFEDPVLHLHLESEHYREGCIFRQFAPSRRRVRFIDWHFGTALEFVERRHNSHGKTPSSSTLTILAADRPGGGVERGPHASLLVEFTCVLIVWTMGNQPSVDGAAAHASRPIQRLLRPSNGLGLTKAELDRRCQPSGYVPRRVKTGLVGAFLRTSRAGSLFRCCCCYCFGSPSTWLLSRRRKYNSCEVFSIPILVANLTCAFSLSTSQTVSVVPMG
jgi:hypothetical protein